MQILKLLLRMIPSLFAVFLEKRKDKKRQTSIKKSLDRAKQSTSEYKDHFEKAEQNRKKLKERSNEW